MIKKMIIAVLAAVIVMAIMLAVFGLICSGIYTFVFQIAFFLGCERKFIWIAIGIMTAILTLIIFAVSED